MLKMINYKLLHKCTILYKCTNDKCTAWYKLKLIPLIRNIALEIPSLPIESTLHEEEKRTFDKYPLTHLNVFEITN